MATRKTKTEAKSKGRAPKAGHSTQKAAKPLVEIRVTPPELLPGSPAKALDRRLADTRRHPGAETFAETPWFSQAEALQAGYHLLTDGLRENLDHPELEICNVPGAFVPEALRLLEVVAGYVLDGTRLDPGEMMLLAERPKAMIAFMRVEPGERGSAHEEDVLRVVFVS